MLLSRFPLPRNSGRGNLGWFLLPHYSAHHQHSIWLPTIFPHNQDIATFILRWQEDFRHHYENLALWRRVDVPSALHICRIVSRVVGRLNITSVLTQLPSTLSIYKETCRDYYKIFISLCIYLLDFYPSHLDQGSTLDSYISKKPELIGWQGQFETWPWHCEVTELYKPLHITQYAL